MELLCVRVLRHGRRTWRSCVRWRRGEGEFADLAADGVAVFPQHVEAVGDGLLAGVDERDVVLEVAHGHAG